MISISPCQNVVVKTNDNNIYYYLSKMLGAILWGDFEVGRFDQVSPSSSQCFGTDMHGLLNKCIDDIDSP